MAWAYPVRRHSPNFGCGVSRHRVVAGDTLFGIAQNSYGDGNLWPRLFTANRDRISDLDLIQVGQILRQTFSSR